MDFVVLDTEGNLILSEVAIIDSRPHAKLFLGYDREF
jgi:hypothetical protein